MNSTASPQVYHSVTKVFHWITALLILTVIPLGVIANGLPFETDSQLATKARLFSMHKTLGVVIFFVALARILWALTQPKPGPLHPERRAETLLADVVHWLLYLSLVAVPLTGWIHHAATQGFAPIWLPLGQDLPFVPKDESIAKLFAGLHWVWSKILAGSILLHVAGALKHQIIDKDATLRRMWFGAAEAPETSPHKSNIAAPLVAAALYAIAAGGGAAAGLYASGHSAAPPSLEAVASEWTVQEGEISITVTQLGNPVTGYFADWTAAIDFDETKTGELGSVEVTIAISSLSLGSVTQNALEPDFFDAATFPTAQYKADITSDRAGDYIALGDLTIKDISHPLPLGFDLELDGDRAVVTAQTQLDRRDFNIGNSMSDESSLGFTVLVDIALAATRDSSSQ